jgi:hypothetical protein
MAADIAPRLAIKASVVLPSKAVYVQIPTVGTSGCQSAWAEISVHARLVMITSQCDYVVEFYKHSLVSTLATLVIALPFSLELPPAGAQSPRLPTQPSERTVSRIAGHTPTTDSGASADGRMPDWLRPLHNHGLIATLDDAGDVTALCAGEVINDEHLARLKALPKLRELELGTTKYLSKQGIAHLGRLSALEVLRLTGVNEPGPGLGDAALAAASRLPMLRELSIAECGTTDDGVRYVRLMPRLTKLTLRQEGRLTDNALASIARMKRLAHLDLSSYVATERYGRMRFSPESLRQLASLQDLEVLRLAGHAPGPDLFALPKLQALSVGGVDDSAAERIAQCRKLASLELLYADITNVGLPAIATLPELRHLSISSSIITDAGIAHLQALPQLEHLELRATLVGDDSLKHLASIKTLTRLDLNGSGRPGAALGRRFTIDGLRYLKQLPGLRTLCLTNLELNGGFGVFRDLTNLRELSLMMTDISEGEVADLEDALPNTRISAVSGAGSVGVPKLRRSRRGGG